jgi:hypothetical protein
LLTVGAFSQILKAEKAGIGIEDRNKWLVIKKSLETNG